MKKYNMENNRKALIIVAMFGLIIAIIGGTLAYWNWQSTEAQKTVVPVQVCSTSATSTLVLSPTSAVSALFLSAFNSKKELFHSNIVSIYLNSAKNKKTSSKKIFLFFYLNKFLILSINDVFSILVLVLTSSLVTFLPSNTITNFVLPSSVLFFIVNV